MLDPVSYVFVTTQAPDALSQVPAIMRFTEAEGETLIVSDAAELPDDVTRSDAYARITLNVHSALDAVGFLAAVCTALARGGISTNAVAAFYHDHIFVPRERAQDAITILETLSASA